MELGDIPVLVAGGSSLARMWENSLLTLWENGCRIPTQYDRSDREGNPMDPPSLDCTMLMVCEEPLAEPMIHRAFPGGLEDLEEYRLEVVEGVKDHWVRQPGALDDERWEYTYHGRLTSYPAKRRTEPTGAVTVEPFDQLEYLVDRLAEEPHTRRAIAHTWVVGEDNYYLSPPCLQGLWVRALPAAGDGLKLNLDVHFRSRDAYDAALMNCFALAMLQKELARRLREKLGRPVVPGRYVDFSDSYHIYGRRIADFEERFLKLYRQRSFEERTWTLEFAQPFFDEARPKILEKIRNKDAETVRER